jgi:hypothetical protein
VIYTFTCGSKGENFVVTFTPFGVLVRLSVRNQPIVGYEFGFRTSTVLPVNTVYPLTQQKWSSKTLNFSFVMLIFYDLIWCVLIGILVFICILYIDKFEGTACVNIGFPDDGTRECRCRKEIVCRLCLLLSA